MAFGIFQGSCRIGLELGARSVKAAWIVQRPGGRADWRYAEQARRHDPSPEILRGDLAQLLQPLRRYRFSAQVVLAAPNSYLRRLTIRVPDARRLATALREQLPTLLPFDADRAQTQYVVLRQQRIDGQLEYTVVVAACEQAAVQQDLDTLWQIGWAPSAVAPAALVLVQTAKALKAIDQEPVVLMDIGQRRTTIVLLDQGEAVYARDVALGDDHLEDALMGHVSVGQQTLSLSREQAVALKQELGVPEMPAAEGSSAERIGQVDMPLPTYLAMIQPVLEQLVSELRRTITAGTKASNVPAPTRILVSGDGAALPHFDQWLSKQIGLPITQLSCEPWLGSAARAAALTCGLALFDRSPSLDLQPRASCRRGTLARAAAQLWKGLAVVALLVSLGSGWWYAKDSVVARQLKPLERQWTSLQPLASLQDQISDSTNLVERLANERGVPLGWFRRLASNFPNPVRLTQLTVSAQRAVSMVGQAQERGQTPEAQVSELVLWLERAHVCREVQLGASRRIEPNGTLVEFSLTCAVP